MKECSDDFYKFSTHFRECEKFDLQQLVEYLAEYPDMYPEEVCFCIASWLLKPKTMPVAKKLLQLGSKQPRAMAVRNFADIYLNLWNVIDNPDIFEINED